MNTNKFYVVWFVFLKFVMFCMLFVCHLYLLVMGVITSVFGCIPYNGKCDGTKTTLSAGRSVVSTQGHTYKVTHGLPNPNSEISLKSTWPCDALRSERLREPRPPSAFW